jgi:adenylate kinase
VRPDTRLIILGKQGAGKGTQAVSLSHHYVVSHISTGDMFRAAVRQGSEFGKKAKVYLDAGELVPDEVVIGVVRERLDPPTLKQGFILDGFPRTVRQAEELFQILGLRGIEMVIDLEIDTEVVLRRLASRMVCSDCGANYSVQVRPRLNGVCDVCGGDVVHREDDNEAAIRRRLELYERETAPLISFYAERQLLFVCDATGTPQEVTERLVAEIDRRRGSGLWEGGGAGLWGPHGSGLWAAGEGTAPLGNAGGEAGELVSGDVGGLGAGDGGAGYAAGDGAGFAGGDRAGFAGGEGDRS